jgi:predicted amidohydrolase
MSEKKLRIAAVQSHAELGTVEANFGGAEALFMQAAEAGAYLVVPCLPTWQARWRQ